MTLLGSFQTYPTLTLISCLGVLMTAAFLLWTIQRVFLGPLNPKYAKLAGHRGREIFCQSAVRDSLRSASAWRRSSSSTF